jgi:hypothetical protein
MYLHVTFFPHASMFGTPLLMNGKGELHLTETALISEGNAAKFNVPFVMSFYQRMLSSWTTMTVPYSCIVRHRYSGYWFNLSLARVMVLLLLLLLALPAAALFANTNDPMSLPIGLGVLGTLALIALVVLIQGRRRHHVTFRLPSGWQTVLVFKIKGPPRQTHAEFTRLLAEYLETSRTFEKKAA